MWKLFGTIPPGRIDVWLWEVRIASFEPVEVVGLSKSIPDGISPAVLLLCLRCRFDDVAELLAIADAPGPGIALGGAAAMGMTPLPPMAAAEDVAEFP